MNKVVKTLLFLLLLICFGCEEKPPYKIPKYPEIEQIIYFEGDYPPVVQVTYEEDGQTYHVDAVQGQVMVYFTDQVSHDDAVHAIREAGGKIVAQMPKVHYYLVNTGVGMETLFMKKIINNSTAFVFHNAVSYPCAATPYIMDDFAKRNDDEATHGDMVTFTLQECDSIQSIKRYNENIDGKGLKWSEIVKDLNDILSNSLDSAPPIINMSFGVPLKKNKKQVYWKDASDTLKADYSKAYIAEIIALLNIIEKYDEKDFVIVKSTGNCGVKAFKKEIITPLYNELNEKHRALMDKHVILVAAEDSRWSDYSNELEEGIFHKWVSTVDISDLQYNGENIYGTSFSAPRVSCFITTASEKFKLNPTEVLKYVRKATKCHPKHLLTMEGLSEQIVKGNLSKDEGDEENSSSESAESDNKPLCGMGWYDYSATIPYSEELFKSKRMGSFSLPNGDVIKYQYVYECDFLPEYYMKFTMGNGGIITSKYNIALVKTMQDEKGYVGTDKNGYIDMRISFLGFDPDSSNNMIVLIRKK